MDKISSDEIIHNIKQVSEKYYEILSYIMQGKINLLPANFLNPEKINEVLLESYKQFLGKPEKFFKLNLEYMERLQNLLATSFSSVTDKIDKDSEKDRRFKDQAWHNSIYFNFIRQFYEISSEFAEKYMDEYSFHNDLKKYTDFQLKQFLNATSPTNFIFSNPTVLKETLESNWQNIVRGLDNFLADLKKSGDIFTIPTTNSGFFQKGKNIAASKGKVVYQNKLVQLICYEPKERAHSIPLLIVPPWINKYYILDLSENNSLVKFLTENNFQLFMVSWVNPDKSYADTDFEDYLKYGIIEPCKYLQTLGIKKINALGYCIGGTLLACSLAWFQSQDIDFINTATFFTTLLDFSDPGEIGIFINEEAIGQIEDEMNKKGYLDGRYLSNSFSLLRSGDLIWSFFVNNYLLGKSPMPFDLLYWNADSTNLPAKMHSYYLRNMYLNNLLKKPGGLTMLNVPINLSLINLPSFFVAAEQDHIAPWQAVYNSAALLAGDKTFCLTSSGHIAGIINPANNTKYNYQTNKQFANSASEWLSTAENHTNSWWNYWLSWLKEHSGNMTKPVSYEKLKSLEPAPGSYCS